MQKKSAEFIKEILIKGRHGNGTLNRKLVQYKDQEKKFTADWVDREKDPKKYQEEAIALCESWIGLVVDIACDGGIRLGEGYVQGLRATYKESVLDSIGAAMPRDPGLCFDD